VNGARGSGADWLGFSKAENFAAYIYVSSTWSVYPSVCVQVRETQ